MTSRYRFILVMFTLLAAGLFAIAYVYWRVSTEPSRHDYSVEYQVNPNPGDEPPTQMSLPATDNQIPGQWFGAEQRTAGVTVYWSPEPDNRLLFASAGRSYELPLENDDRAHDADGHLLVVRSGMLLEFDWASGRLEPLPERDNDFGLVGKQISDIRSDKAWIVYYGCDADLPEPTGCRVHAYDRAAGRVTASVPIAVDLYESSQIMSWDDGAQAILFRSTYGEGPSVGGSIFRLDMRSGTRTVDWGVGGVLTCLPDPAGALPACDRARTTEAMIAEAWFLGTRAIKERQQEEHQPCAKDVDGSVSAEGIPLGCFRK